MVLVCLLYRKQDPMDGLHWPQQAQLPNSVEPRREPVRIVQLEEGQQTRPLYAVPSVAEHIVENLTACVRHSLYATLYANR